MTIRRILTHFFFLAFPLITLGEKETAFFPKNQLFFIISTALLALTLFDAWKQKKPFKFPLIFLPVFLAGIWGLITTIFSNYYEPLSITTVLTNINPELIFCFFWLVGTTNLFNQGANRSEATIYLLGGMVIPLLIGLYQFTQTFPFVLTPEEFRLFIFGTYPNPLVFAASLLPMIFIAISFAFSETSLKRWLAIVGAGLGIFLVLATLSRSVWIAGLFGIALFVVSFKKQLKSNWLPLICLVALTLLSVFSLRSEISGRVINSNLPSQSQTSISRRFAIWDSGLKTFFDHPILGSGNNTFEVAVLKFRNNSLNNDPTLWESPFFAENFVLRTLVESGLVGLLLLTLFVAGITITVLKNQPGPTIFPIAAIVYALTALQAEAPLFPLFVFLSLTPIKTSVNLTFSKKVVTSLCFFATLIIFFNLKALVGIIISPYPQTYLTYENQSLLKTQLVRAVEGFSLVPESYHSQASLLNRTADMTLWGKEKITVPNLSPSNNPFVLLGQIRLALSQNNLKLASQLISKLEPMDENDPRLWNLSGVLATKQNNLPKAKAFFLKAITLKPDHYQSLHNLGVVTNDRDKISTAATLFEKYNHFHYFPNTKTLDY